MDLYGHNPFSWRPPDLRQAQEGEMVDMSDLDVLARLVDRNLKRTPKQQIRFFLSEFTLPTAVDSDFNFHVDPETQAAWIRSILRITEGWSRIYALNWIHPRDIPGGVQGGLLYSNGERKPGYFAFRDG
jgi:hypothetical protein